MIMKLLIVAASGGLGQKLVLEALARGHFVSVLVRNLDKLASLGAARSRLTAEYQGSGADTSFSAVAAAGVDAIISAAPPDPKIAAALGGACAASATCKRMVWTAGGSNILEPDGATFHSKAFGARGEGFFNAHAPCIKAVQDSGAKHIIWCPGFMKAVGRKSPRPVEISTRAIPGGLKRWDFVSYEDAADAILRAVETDKYDGEHITAITSDEVEVEL